jgi:acyl carrier protein
MQQPAQKPGETADTADMALRGLLSDVLGLSPIRVAGFTASTGLFGSLPEFDSMAVANFLTEMEERLGILIEDDDVEAEDFMTYGRLLHFVRRKIG